MLSPFEELMTIPSERTRAILNTERFLMDIVVRRYKRVPKEVQEQARRCLRHYPTRFEVNQITTKYNTHFFEKVND